MTKVLEKVMYAVFVAVIAASFVIWKKIDTQFNAYTCNTDPVIVQEGDSMYEIAISNFPIRAPAIAEKLFLKLYSTPNFAHL